MNTKNNTQDNHSFIQHESEGMSEEEIQDKVMEDLTIQQAIPYWYASDPKMMECAIHYLTEWEFRCKHPFLTPDSFMDERRMNAFQFCVKCLIEMACARQPANYRGALISYANVIDAINRNSDHCTEGGLSEFLEQTMDDFLNACENTEITDIRKYTKSLIWSSFSTYKVKLDAACLS